MPGAASRGAVGGGARLLARKASAFTAVAVPVLGLGSDDYVGRATYSVGSFAQNQSKTFTFRYGRL